MTGPGRWWREFVDDDGPPAYRDPDPWRTLAAGLVGALLLVIVAAVLIALDTGVARGTVHT